MVPKALTEWARRPGARIVLAEARRRAERRTLGQRGVLNVALTAAERSDAGILLGVAWEAGSARPSIHLLRKQLRTYGVTLEQLLVQVGGPIDDHVEHRERVRDLRSAEEAGAERVLSDALAPDLIESVTARCLPAAGRGARLQRAEHLAEIARRLPGDATPIPLAVLAARCFGDAHALDRTAPLGRAAARMAALIGTGQDEVPTAQGWRSAWAAVGVACDRVSSTVLVLNLPLAGSPALEALTGVSGEPVWLTGRTVDGAPDLRPATSRPVVFVCENPSVVETAADRLGPRSAPLVCTYGKPSLAALTLLRALDRCGVALRVRADNDPAGRAIVTTVLSSCPGATTWRFGVASPVFEEQLVDDLVSDLTAY